ncbi:MAG: DUF2095 family protein [Thermoproteota archaeon]|nr:DUF2095 family protein [Thermoproteota archaeon]
MEIEENRFKKMFPNLAKEMQSNKNKVGVTSVRSETKTGENAASKNFVHYEPDVIDFLRRCDNRQQAEEIITYLEKRKEISLKYARKLQRQLKEKGVRSFGPKKKEDYYLKQTTKIWRSKNKETCGIEG